MHIGRWSLNFRTVTENKKIWNLKEYLFINEFSAFLIFSFTLNEHFFLSFNPSLKSERFFKFFGIFKTWTNNYILMKYAFRTEQESSSLFINEFSALLISFFTLNEKFFLCFNHSSSVLKVLWNIYNINKVLFVSLFKNKFSEFLISSFTFNEQFFLCFNLLNSVLKVFWNIQNINKVLFFNVISN